MVNYLIFAVWNFQLSKKWCLQNFYTILKCMMLVIVDKNVFKVMTLPVCYCRIIWFSFASFKTIMLCSVLSIWPVKYEFSAEIWFVTTLTRIVKYESQVAKSNPENLFTACIYWNQLNAINKVCEQLKYAPTLFNTTGEFILLVTNTLKYENAEVISQMEMWHKIKDCEFATNFKIVLLLMQSFICSP